MKQLLALVALVAFTLPALAEDLTLGYIALETDPRYDENFAYARIALRPQGDSFEGMKLAVEDMKILTDAKGLTVTLDEMRVRPETVASAGERMVAEGIGYIIADLPAESIALLADAVGGAATILNTTAPEDSLRRACYPGLLHTAASDRMISDALIQHLVRQEWTKVLLLHGKTERDTARAESFAEAAKRMRVDIVDTRVFDLSTNPALREENNIMLLTGGIRDYDVIVIADEYGEYSRYVPFQTALPRPVVGATGLVPAEWHWALERYGAPQVNSRFEAETGRRMGWQDWSTWVAARAVLTAYAKARAPGTEGDFLRSERLKLDGSKGVPMTFRPWNGQLRMPILLATHNAIVDIAPIEGFMHQLNTLDTLGQDEAEFACD